MIARERDVLGTTPKCSCDGVEDEGYRLRESFGGSDVALAKAG